MSILSKDRGETHFCREIEKNNPSSEGFACLFEMSVFLSWFLFQGKELRFNVLIPCGPLWDPLHWALRAVGRAERQAEAGARGLH